MRPARPARRWAWRSSTSTASRRSATATGRWPPTWRSRGPRSTGATRSSARRGAWWCRCVAQALDLRRSEPPGAALGEVAEAQRAERDALQPGHRVADVHAHALDLALAALAQRE